MDSADHINVVASMGLAKLQHEPARLAAEADRLNVELESLVMDNYRVFVENLTCSTILRAEDKAIKVVSAELDSQLRGLSQQCLAFKDRVSHFVDVHKRNRKTLQHHMQLVELLEIPQLVDACARNGFHDEALELSNFVNGLERRHLLAAEVRSTDGNIRGGSNVVQSIVDDVHRTLVALRLQLLLSLSESISLPKQMTVLSTLRKLDALFNDRQLALERFDSKHTTVSPDTSRISLRQHMQQSSEVKLQMDYLEARTVWLRKVADKTIYGGGLSIVENGSSGTGNDVDLSETSKPSGVDMPTNRAELGPYGQAMELLEVNRTSWYSVVTQFNAIFGGSSNSSVDYASESILGAWIGRQVHSVLSDLQTLLPSIEGASSFRTVLEQAIFFAVRMSEVRVDFSGLLLPIFKRDILRRVDKDFSLALSTFKSMISTERITIEVDDIPKEQMIPLIAANDRAGVELPAIDISRLYSTGDEWIAQAPVVLMNYPPLAYLCNAVLCSLNFVRECPLLVARNEVLAMLRWLIDATSSYIIQQSANIRSKSQRYLDDNKGRLRHQLESASCSNHLDNLYARVIANELVPHWMLCFERIFLTAKESKSELTLKEVVSADSYALLQSTRDTLTAANLLSG